MMIARFDRLEDKVDGLTEDMATMKNKYAKSETKLKTTNRIWMGIVSAAVTLSNIALSFYFR